MKKWLLLIISLVVSMAFLANPTPAAQPSFQMCKESVTINTNCTLVTPTLQNCTTPDYTIYNMSGDMVESKNLTQLSGDIYFLNFTLPKGDYIVRLCDGSTREINIVEGDNYMIIGFIILLPMLLGLLIIWGASSLDGETHPALKIGLFVLSLLSFLLSLHLAMMSIVKFYDWPEMQEVLAFTSNWYVWIVAFIIIYILLYIIITGFNIARNNKQEQMKY
jgi:hypothetical protein